MRATHHAALRELRRDSIERSSGFSIARRLKITNAWSEMQALLSLEARFETTGAAR